MSPEEKAKFKEMYPRMLEGYRMAQRVRDEDLIGLDTQFAIAQLRGAFQMAAKLPVRQSSGLDEFYRKLARGK